MDRLAIEINGAGLLVADSREVLASEPGYAIVDAARRVTGMAAYNQARLQPAKTRSGFWSGLRVAGSTAESNAELAYEHLKQVWNQAGRPSAGAVLIVPGSYDTEQLGLVLGIAQECGIRVEAMVDAGVAASALRYDGRQLLYVDASLKTVSATRVNQAEVATIDACEMSQATGLAEFTDEMVRAIARVFVLETRFDPLHKAETEQALYDGLPVWLEALYREGVVTAEIRHAGEPVAVELTIERVRSASLRLFREIANLIASLRTPGMPAVVQINHRLARLPGLRAELQRIEGIELSELAPGFPAVSALQRMRGDDGADDEVRLVRRLPFTGRSDTLEVAPRSAPERTESHVEPTHVIFEGIGYRLDNGRVEVANGPPTSALNGTRTIVIGRRGGSAGGTHCVLQFDNGTLAVQRSAGASLSVNDDPVETRRELRIGDVVRIGDPAAELHIVALED
jgi:hypothetical protein